MVRSAGECDVAVVGAGPAGALAAATAAAALPGGSVLLLERAALPRYKTCGGGLIGLSTAALPAGTEVPVRTRVDRVTFTRGTRRSRTWCAETPVLQMVNRDEFDAALVARARTAGAQLRERTTGDRPAGGRRRGGDHHHRR